MRRANRILGVIRDRGSRGLPLERVYRLLFNRNLYLLAYGRLARNNGALTPGSTPETVDGMALAKIEAIIATVRHERYQWTPVRRIYIEKQHTMKQRPLGLPTWSDKLLQEVLRLILEAYFEPQFSDHSHGFRPHRGCHTALLEISRHWTGTAWFIEGDIAQCFDALDHEVLLMMLNEHIHDGRFLWLIRDLLTAGYLEEWRYYRTLSGTPQGAVLSPILSNIYLDRLDQFVASVLLPQYNRGDKRRSNKAYDKMSHRANYLAKTGRNDEAARLRRLRRTIPSVDPQDPGYRRLRYLRYADDFLLGFNGPRWEAEEVKQQLATFLRDELRLELSEKKTLITHARSTSARFLGYEVSVIHNDHRLDQQGRRATNGTISLKVPLEVVRRRCRRYMRYGKPIHRPECLFDRSFSIIAQYQQEFRGVAAYYRFASNRSRQLGRLKYIMEQSLTKTLAQKYQISVPTVYDRYQTLIATSDGPIKGLEVRIEREGRPPLVAQWGGISLKRQLQRSVLDDAPKPIWNDRTELVTRLLADVCELCGSTTDIQVHHVRRLKDFQRPGRGTPPAWVQKMASRRRKTLVVCKDCHHDIHAGRAIG